MERPSAALALVRDAGDITPYVASMSRLVVALHCLCGDLDAGEDELERALEQGRWWHADLFRNLAWFSGLWGRSRFEQLMQWSMELRDAALDQLAAPRRPTAYVFGRGSPRAVLLLLHGGQSKVEGFARPWHPIVDDRWLVVAPQSSQQTSSDGVYGWPDGAVARKEIAAAFAAALGKHADARHLPLVIGGLSTGGELAIEIALAGAPLATRGFVVIAPCLRDPNWPARQRPIAGLVGSMIVGEWDPWLDRAAALDRELTAAGASSRLDLVPHMGHLGTFPSDVGARLVRELARVRDAAATR